MNPLPRFVALALFVVLVALVGLLAVPVWQGLRSDAPPTSAADPKAGASVNRVIRLAQRGALVVAAAGLALSVVLLLHQTAQARPPRGAAEPLATVRKEVDALTRLAESTVAQGEELSRERDVRRRAEEDARLKQQLLEQSLDEKIRLGRDLHDGIIQSLYAAGLTLEAVRPLVKSDPAEAEARLEKMRGSLNSAIRDVRTYIVGLAPENLRRAGFAKAVSTLLGELQAGREARFEIQIDDAAAAQLTSEQSIEFLQIAREAVSNAFRHGRATVLTLRMTRGEHDLSLLIQDNGAGFETKRRHNDGFGLGNMRARAERIGASLTITSEPGAGTQVLAILPLFTSPAS